MAEHCAISRCKRPEEVIYLRVPMCTRHWFEFADDDADPEERLQWLKKRTPRDYSPRITAQLHKLRKSLADLPAEEPGRVRVSLSALERLKDKHRSETPGRCGSGAGG